MKITSRIDNISCVEEPFVKFLGTWLGGGNLFTPNGTLGGSVSSNVDIWMEDGKFNYKQEFQHGRSSGPIPLSTRDQWFKYTLNGKTAHASAADGDILVKRDGQWVPSSRIREINGFMSVNDIYLFVIKYWDGSELTNNHYFIADNTRRIIGPVLSSGDDVQYLVEQTFTAYTPPSIT